MDLKLSILLIAIFAVLSKADDLQCTGCLCAAADDSTLFARGDQTTLCVHFLTVDKDSGEIVAKRAAYPIAVDTFSSVQLAGGQGTFLAYDFVGIVVQTYGAAMTLPLTYLQVPQNFYSSVFSVVIQISNGAIKSVIWDHRCSTCDSSDCYKFSLANGTLIDTICNNQTCQSATDPDCDPQVYISWVGSDKNGVKMTSAGTRLSRFRQFSATELLSSKTIPAYVMPTPDGSDSNGGTDDGTNTGSDSGSGSGTGDGTNAGSDSGSSSGDNSGTETGSGSSSNEDSHSGTGGTETNSGSGSNTENSSESSQGDHSGANTETNSSGTNENTQTETDTSSGTGSHTEGGEITPTPM